MEITRRNCLATAGGALLAGAMALPAAADDAVYRSKRAGKNRVSLADTQEGEDGQGPGSYQ